MKESVNHPSHYNSHPNGIECIDIIRHYTCDIANALKYLWRAGLKVPSKREQYQTRLSIAECEETRPIGQTEMDKAAIEREKSDAGIGSSERELTRLKVKEDADKEIEDLKKALWYIEDYRYMCDKMRCHHSRFRSSAGCSLFRLSGHHIEDVTKGYDENVAHAMDYLLRVGMISGSTLYAEDNWAECLQMATRHIQDRILAITAAQESAETAAVSAASPADEYSNNPYMIHFL